jgi:peptidoglycan/LPS O-acetylase OafA/YrhL
MARRVLRIYPAHLVALLLFVPLAYFTLFRIPVADPARLEASGALLVPWVGDFVYGHLLPGQWLRTAVLYNNYYNPVTWTLQVELIGSLFVPFFAAWSRSRSLRRDLAALAILAAAALLVDAEKRPDLFPLYLPAFYLGCMVRTRGRRLAEMVGSTPCRLYGGLAVLLALLLVPHAVVRTGLATIPVHLAVGLMTLGGFGLVSLVASGTGQGRAGAAMLHPVSRRVGRLSYSFYLWHDLVLFAFVRLLFIAVAPDALAAWPLTVFVSTMVATVLLALAVAAISYALVEKPFIALGRKLDRRLASATPGKAAGGPAPV